jgi:hypothetical protein
MSTKQETSGLVMTHCALTYHVPQGNVITTRILNKQTSKLCIVYLRSSIRANPEGLPKEKQLFMKPKFIYRLINAVVRKTPLLLLLLLSAL